MKPTQHSNKNDNARRTRRFRPLCLMPYALCLPLLLSPAQAFSFEFDGSLKEVKITDASGTNKPPTAVINYTQNGATFTFDASASSDPDGSIVEYKWDFGDGSNGVGFSISHSFSDSKKIYNVTLTAIDDKGGASLTSSVVDLTSLLIKDNFNVDTSSNYTPTGNLSVSNAAAHGKIWTTSIAYHTTTLDSADHWVQGDVAYNGLYDSGGLAARVDPGKNTGYTIAFSSGRINLEKFSGTQRTWLALYDGKYAAGNYTLKLEVVGSRITVSVNGVVRIIKDDATYQQGRSIGARFSRSNANTDVTVDNLTAGIFVP